MKPEGLRFKRQSALVALGRKRSCKKCDQKCEPENVDFFGLTKSVHTQLPRELRDIIYNYLLSPQDILLLASGTSTRLDRFPYAPGDEPTEYKTHGSLIPLPPYTDPETSYPGFASEVFEFVYEHHPGLWIDMPSAIPKFLDFDFFGTGIKPRHARLKKLHISGSLDPGTGNAINIATLASDLRSLFDISLARGFSLDIVFRTELGVSHFYRSMLAPLAEAMAQVASITKPFIAELEQRGGNAHFLMLTKHKMYVYATGAGSTNGGSDMYETQEQWFEDLDRNLGHICYGPYNAWVAEREVARLSRDGGRTGRWWKRALCFK